MDINGAKLQGAITAAGVRAFWRDGKTYIAYSPTSVMVLDTPDQPRPYPRGYKLTLEGTERLYVARPCCESKRDRTLGQMTQEQLMAAALEPQDA